LKTFYASLYFSR